MPPKQSSPTSSSSSVTRPSSSTSRPSSSTQGPVAPDSYDSVKVMIKDIDKIKSEIDPEDFPPRESKRRFLLFVVWIIGAGFVIAGQAVAFHYENKEITTHGERFALAADKIMSGFEMVLVAFFVAASAAWFCTGCGKKEYGRKMFEIHYKSNTISNSNSLSTTPTLATTASLSTGPSLSIGPSLSTVDSLSL